MTDDQTCRCPDCRCDSADPLERFARWIVEMEFDQIETAHPQRILRGIAVRAEQALADQAKLGVRPLLWNDRSKRAPL